jgi:hypothetical protein
MFSSERFETGQSAFHAFHIAKSSFDTFTKAKCSSSIFQTVKSSSETFQTDNLKCVDRPPLFEWEEMSTDNVSEGGHAPEQFVTGAHATDFTIQQTFS